jgi:hypothetical protein
MTPQDMIDALDAGLADTGEQVRLLRMARSPQTGIVAEVTIHTMIRGYSPIEVAAGSGISQQDQKMIFSPTPIRAAGWPGTANPIPREGDRVVSTRGVLTIQAAAGIYVKNVLVRIEAQVRGA